MENKGKIFITFVGVVAIAFTLSYFLTPAIEMIEGRTLSASDLANNTYSNKDENISISFNEDYTVNYKKGVNNTVVDRLYSYTLNEGIIEINSDNEFQIMSNNSLFNIISHYYLYRN